MNVFDYQSDEYGSPVKVMATRKVEGAIAEVLVRNQKYKLSWRGPDGLRETDQAEAKKAHKED